MQAGRRGSRVAVLDTIHGAAVIARKMVEAGWQAEAFEVYHHTPDLSSFDLIVSPVHLSPYNPALEKARSEGKGRDIPSSGCGRAAEGGILCLRDL